MKGLSTTKVLTHPFAAYQEFVTRLYSPTGVFQYFLISSSLEKKILFRGRENQKMSAKLLSSYNAQLMANPRVRFLVASVSQDPQNETINLSASQSSVAKKASETSDNGEARRQIIGWLNEVYFTQLKAPFPIQWWWEMHTRLQKLLVVSMILEGNNLRSFGAVPQMDDIPQCLIGLQKVLENVRPQFSSLREQYLIDAKSLNPEYLVLYTQ